MNLACAAANLIWSITSAPASLAFARALADPRQAQENLMWESAQHSNLGADYQAYLSAFPAGVFAQMQAPLHALMANGQKSG